MLLYHPFFDSRHCVFRILQLLVQVGKKEVELQRLRVWDFYLLFPEALLKARLPQGNTRLRRQLEASQNRYDIMPDAKRAFARLEPIQEAALRHLAAKELIDAKLMQDDRVIRTEVPIPQDLIQLINGRNAEFAPVLDFLTTTFFSVDLYGANGIRQRTELFDHRYDLSRTTSTA